MWNNYENDIIAARALLRSGRHTEAVDAGTKAWDEFQTRMAALAKAQPRLRGEIGHVLGTVEHHDAENFAKGAARCAASDASSRHCGAKRTRSAPPLVEPRDGRPERRPLERTRSVSRHARRRFSRSACRRAEAGRVAVVAGVVRADARRGDVEASVHSHDPRVATDASPRAAHTAQPVNGDLGHGSHRLIHSEMAARLMQARERAALQRAGSTETTADSTEREQWRRAQMAAPMEARPGQRAEALSRRRADLEGVLERLMGVRVGGFGWRAERDIFWDHL